MCLPLLPLVVLRVELPRVVIALAALGRWREAWVRFGIYFYPASWLVAIAVFILPVHRLRKRYLRVDG